MQNRFAKTSILVKVGEIKLKSFGSLTPTERIYYFETKSHEQAIKKNALLDRLAKEFGVEKKQVLTYHNEIIRGEETQSPIGLAKSINDYYEWETFLQEQDPNDTDLTYFINSRIDWTSFAFDEFATWYGINIDPTQPKWTNRCALAMGTDTNDIQEFFSNELAGIKPTETATVEKNSPSSNTLLEEISTPNIGDGTSTIAE